MANHYQTLGVPRNATKAEIKRAYRSRAKAIHPDHHPGANANRRFAELQRAYKVLSNPSLRRRYDMILDGVRVRRHKKPTGPPKDDRKYGTRHRYSNPPPTRTEQERRYKEALEYYSLFTRKGMRLPREEWWRRLDLIIREWGSIRARHGHWGFFGALAPGIFAVYHFIRHGATATGFLWLIVSLFFLRSSYRDTVRQMAERKRK